MLGLLSQMVTRWTTPATSEAVEAVVRRCCKRVIDRVGRTPLTMPSTEARGYIRALAISIVREHLDFVLEQEFPSLMSKRDALLQTSLEEVTSFVLKHCREQLRTRFILRQAA